MLVGNTGIDDYSAVIELLVEHHSIKREDQVLSEPSYRAWDQIASPSPI